MGTDPTRAADLVLGVGQLNAGLGLLFWDAVPGATYEVHAGLSVAGPFGSLGTVTADQPDMERIVPFGAEAGFFRFFKDRGLNPNLSP